MTKSKEVDESSSTHGLAETETGSGDSGEYDRLQGPQTYITSRASRSNTSRDGRGHGMGGIHVRNEMSIQIEQA